MKNEKTTEVAVTLTAQKIYKDLRPSTLAVYSQQREDGIIPAKPDDCPNERGIKDGCNTSLSATHAIYEDKLANLRSKQAELAIDPKAPHRKTNAFRRLMTKAFEEKKAENNDLFEDIKKTKSNIRNKAVAESIGRDPQPSTTSETAAQALPVGAAETLLGVAGFMSGGMSVSEAIIGSAAIAAGNIGMFGYLGGNVLFHYCFQQNAGKLRWLATTALGIMGGLTVWMNLKAFEVRSELNLNENSPTYEADALVSGLVGGAMCFLGLGIAGYWFYRFAKSKDHYLAYGALGDRLADLKAELAEPAAEFRDELIEAHKNTVAEIVGVHEDSRTDLASSEQALLEGDRVVEAFEQAQSGLIAEYERVVNLSRTDGRRILEQHTPDYFSVAPDFSALRHDPLSVQSLKDRYGEQQADYDALKTNVSNAEAELETLSRDLEQRIQAEFGV